MSQDGSCRIRRQTGYLAFTLWTGINMVEDCSLFQSDEMRTRLLSIISVGITLGFLLGMGVVALLRATLDGDSPGLEVAFTIMVLMMGGALIYYVIRTTR
jgi:hypothetical protein